jgi:CRISPR-associated endonuclease Cas2
MFLVCYDIQEDKLRTRLAKKLLAAGLERLQFSVFIGDLTESGLSKLATVLTGLISKSTVPSDSIVVFPLHADALEGAMVFGRPMDYYLFPPNTLFI